MSTSTDCSTSCCLPAPSRRHGCKGAVATRGGASLSSQMLPSEAAGKLLNRTVSASRLRRAMLVSSRCSGASLSAASARWGSMCPNDRQPCLLRHKNFLRPPSSLAGTSQAAGRALANALRCQNPVPIHLIIHAGHSVDDGHPSVGAGTRELSLLSLSPRRTSSASQVTA
jgi:hypothetical protein